LTGFPETLQARPARKSLEKKRVEVRVETKVVNYDGEK
jgi:hypothetical protein